MPCYVERTGFTGGQSRAAASGAGTLFSRGLGPTSNPLVSGRQHDSGGRINIPLDASSSHLTQYDPKSPYRVSWDVRVGGDSNLHPTNQSVSPGHPDRHQWPPGYGPPDE